MLKLGDIVPMENGKAVKKMRDIIFRGKRIDNGEWVYGFLLFDEEQNEAYIAEYFEDKAAYLKKVIPETVGQYTGLKDKNGKMIFEGDICQTKGYKLIEEKPFEIVWNDYYSGWFWQDIEVSRETDTLTKTVAELTKVIGNIHDNPELLKGGD